MSPVTEPSPNSRHCMAEQEGHTEQNRNETTNCSLTVFVQYMDHFRVWHFKNLLSQVCALTVSSVTRQCFTLNLWNLTEERRTWESHTGMSCAASEQLRVQRCEGWGWGLAVVLVRDYPANPRSAHIPTQTSVSKKLRAQTQTSSCWTITVGSYHASFIPLDALKHNTRPEDQERPSIR